MWNLIINLASILAPIVLGVSYVPQIIKLYKTKNTGGQSLGFWGILDVSLTMLLLLAVDSGSINMIAVQALNLLFALVVTGQIVYYRRKEVGVEVDVDLEGLTDEEFMAILEDIIENIDEEDSISFVDLEDLLTSEESEIRIIGGEFSEDAETGEWKLGTHHREESQDEEDCECDLDE